MSAPESGVVEIETIVEVATTQVEVESGRTADPLQPLPRRSGATPQSAPAGISIPTPPPSAGALSRQPGGTSFVGSPRSRAVSASADAVSTFSLDTDRTSYQLALNWVNNGFDIEPDSVRAEEWINAFDYRYPRPLRDDSFAIASAVMRHPLMPQKRLARISFQAPELADDSPLNVTLVLDASGSMREGDRVAIAREAAYSILGSLRPVDRIAVVQFTTEVLRHLTVPHTAPDDRALRDSIDNLRPREWTNVQAGIDLGVSLADQARRERPEAHNYVILMSDGVANVDATDPFAILESSGDFDSDNPIRLISIGVGIENFNDHLLEQLAQHGNGWYRYLSDPDQARSTFRRTNWLALSVPFADQTRAQVTWNPEVVNTWRMIGYENRVTSDASFVEARREFAEIPAGAATTVFYELELHQPANIRRDLGEVEIRWDTPITGEKNRQHAAIPNLLRTNVPGYSDELLRFGALVALASDRYSGLSSSEYDGAAIGDELETLKREYVILRRSLGDLDAFQDFGKLLWHMASNPALVPNPPSGYSP
ncbi:MAG: von Willebrand factor type A domain-containing protein [Chloroflexi bacterium]|nr:von Willebrand factor type A domain-containing protein [Chloroflexota bacterium]